MSVNVRDVALRAGVSVGTVSNVLNNPDKVSAATREKVHEAISELGFVRNDAARQLRVGHSRSIGLVVLDIRNPFFTDVARAAEERAADSGHAVLVGNSGQNSTREEMYLDLFEEQRVLGVLISPIGDVTARLERLRERGIPAVLVDRVAANGEFASVSVDDVAGGRLAVDHLLATGRRRIAFVGGPMSIRQVTDRLRGAEEAVRTATDATLEVVITNSLTVLEGRSVGKAIADRAPADRPDAIFAANDLLALGVLQALNMSGTQLVPEQIALVGYDDIDFATAAVVPLTSVRQPRELIGETALEVLLEIVSADAPVTPQAIEFQPELIVRDSSAARVAR